MDKIEASAVVKILTLEGWDPHEITNRMANVYEESAPSFESVKRWAREFRIGRTSLDDAPRSGKPRTSSTPESIDAARKLVLSDRRITVEQVSKSLDISYGSALSILHDERSVWR